MFEKRKLKKQIKILKKEVAAGNLQAMYDLAMIYLDGTILKKDEEAAYSLLRQAADEGHIPAKTYLVSKKLSDGAAIGAQAISDLQAIFKK
ncbi:MAG: SEL1-like repeat protein [Muribaculaceae bacterium]|nr:SEL1-like repeat protein [Muribaculaceae bacterium]